MTAVLNEKTTSSRSIILQEGWRVFFMAAGIYAVVALGVWLVWASGLADLPFAPTRSPGTRMRWCSALPLRRSPGSS